MALTICVSSDVDLIYLLYGVFFCLVKVARLRDVGESVGLSAGACRLLSVSRETLRLCPLLEALEALKS